MNVILQLKKMFPREERKKEKKNEYKSVVWVSAVISYNSLLHILRCWCKTLVLMFLNLP